MSRLNIDTISAPLQIKEKLKELSKSIGFEKQSRKGANGWLFFGTNLVSRKRVAVKFYNWGGDPSSHAEPQQLASLNAENVISVLSAAFVNKEYAYFITPYFGRGDLDDELRNGILENFRAVSYVRNVLSGLSHLHANNLLHRDLKPQNILISNDNFAVIGDFGSVKRIPDGQNTIHGSGHSLIYRPPESIQSDMYGVAGDIYQVGVLLYQLLGGNLPYEETAWLNSRQLKEYWTINDTIDRQLYAANKIKEKIKRGQIINICTLPPWVCKELRRTITKACNRNPNSRYTSCSEFLSRLSKIRHKIKDWRVSDGYPTLHMGKIQYRIVFCSINNIYRVQKRGQGAWRYDNSFTSVSLEEIVAEIEKRVY